MKRLLGIILLSFIVCSCARVKHKEPTINLFAGDLAFLQQNTKVVLLSIDAGHNQVAVCPDLQGRVMTSTAGGDISPSFGWINRELFTAKQRQPQINVFGGEDCFGIGPEGSQFSIFFKKGDSLDQPHWGKPEPLDWGQWAVDFVGLDRVALSRNMNLTNYAGTEFSIHASREVRLLGMGETTMKLGVVPDPEVEQVAYQTTNNITNTGKNGWQKESGILSICIEGMYNPSPQTTIIMPFVSGSEEELGPILNNGNSGKIAEDRLRIEDGVLFLKGDGQQPDKIGISSRRAKPILGSFDAAHHLLTLIQFTQPPEASDYASSTWGAQDNPYNGDVVSAGNCDSSKATSGKPLSFYRLATSSPAAALQPGETLTHVQRTIHFQGPDELLDPIAQQALGVSIEGIKKVFK